MQFLIATIIPIVAAIVLVVAGHTVAAGVVAGIGFTVVMGAFVLWEEFRPRSLRGRKD